MITSNGHTSVVVVHSSDEMYGADRMLLRVLLSMKSVSRPLVFLPGDVKPAGQKLSDRLARESIMYEIGPLPILRRAYITVRGLGTLLLHSVHLLRVLRRERPEVVWLATSACLIAAPIARLAGAKHIVLHNQEIWSGKERLALTLLGLATTNIVSISTTSHGALPPLLRRRSRVIVNGTKVDGSNAAPPTTDRPIFLMASRWNAWKGYRTLLAAWRLAGEPGHLLIAGGPPPVGESVDVPALIKEYGLETSTTVVGEVSDLRPYIEQSHFVVMPSDEPEPFGLIAIEAMACGRPVIASRLGGLGEILRDGVDGYLFENRDIDGLARVLSQRRPNESASMGEVARARFRHLYSADVFDREMDVLWADIGLVAGGDNGLEAGDLD